MTIKINRHFFIPFSPMDSKERVWAQQFKDGSSVRLSYQDKGEDGRANYWDYVKITSKKDGLEFKYLNGSRDYLPCREKFIAGEDIFYLKGSENENRFYYTGCADLRSWIFHEVSFTWEPTLPKQARK